MVKKYMQAGKLVPQRVTSRLVQRYIAQTRPRQCIIFDGYPRNVFQVRALEAAEKKHNREAAMIFIDLPVAVAVARLHRRAKLEGRTDDMDSKAIAQRVKIFKTEAKDVLTYYRGRQRLVRINGDQTIGKVSRDIAKAIHGL